MLHTLHCWSGSEKGNARTHARTETHLNNLVFIGDEHLPLDHSLNLRLSGLVQTPVHAVALLFQPLEHLG